MSLIYITEAVPMKSQKHACLNKTRKMTTPDDMQHSEHLTRCQWWRAVGNCCCWRGKIQSTARGAPSYVIHFQVVSPKYSYIQDTLNELRKLSTYFLKRKSWIWVRVRKTGEVGRIDGRVEITQIHYLYMKLSKELNFSKWSNAFKILKVDLSMT